jgi:signal transduction histidine kinase
VELSRDTVRSVAVAVGSGMSPSDASHAVERLLLEPLTRPLARLGEHACALSRRLGKGEPVLAYAAGGLLADSQRGHALFTALVHVVRNAVDHGLETPEERASLGKGPPVLSFSARVTGGELFVEIEDDGRGVDWERVRALAEARGLPAASSADLVDALFAPALSTRDRVTATSGRGIGLDAVRTEVERLSGRVEVASMRGRGTLFRVRLPLEVLGIQEDGDVPAGERHSTGPVQAREHRPM